MAEYTKYNRGSEWRKWDLHIHTPGTKKNNQFTGTTLDEKWDKYIDDINGATEDIAVVGVTDYLSTENYFKFKQFVQDGRITKQFDLIIPNVELRILPVAGSGTAVNIHCLFNPKIDTEINDRFMSKLSFLHSGHNYSATKPELVRLGRALKSDPNYNSDAAEVAGIEQYVIGYETLWKLFDADKDLRKNTIIVVSNKSNDGATGVVKHSEFFVSGGSSLDATRESIYQLADAVFSSNAGDRDYFVGQKVDDKKTVIKKTGSLKPAFHGCDAHSNSKIFKPDENRFCWIKADPTFEGLWQTVYEPEDRVAIQGDKPDFKTDRFVISELKYKDPTGKLFGDQSIPLSENLNSIIGGKSSGKSLLLYSIAKTIDPEQVNRYSERLGFEGYQFDSAYGFDVVWKNNVVDSLLSTTDKNQKIIYIPQLYINYLVERDNKNDLNTLVEGILLQDSDFRIQFRTSKDKIASHNSEITRLLNLYYETRTEARELYLRLKELGKSKDIEKAIVGIDKAIEEGRKTSNLSETEFDKYKELLEKKANWNKQLTKLKTEMEVMNSIVTELQDYKTRLFGEVSAESNQVLKGSVDRILSQLPEVPDYISSLTDKTGEQFEKLITDLEAEILGLDFQGQIKLAEDGLGAASKELEPFDVKMAGQKALKLLSKNLEDEKKKLEEAKSLERQVQKFVDEIKAIIGKIADLLKLRLDEYSKVVEFVNGTKSDIGSGITLNANLTFPKSDFEFYGQVNKGALTKEHYFWTLFDGDNLNYELIPALFRNQTYRDGKVVVKVGDNSFEIPLKQEIGLRAVLDALVKDSFVIDYNVMYKGDNLLKMSPGKKGTVLLILFLSISSSEYPILIDQPEDNLDNRTIYDLLCTMIKKKKKDRQIIIVSHNANLVVATDSENVIVANQKGQDGSDDDSSSEVRFEYVNGALEHSFQSSSATNVLWKQGIKEHVCDILEGGNEAFLQRERKYSIK